MNAFSKNFARLFFIAPLFLIPPPAHALLTAALPLPANLADCDLRNADHGATERDEHGLRYFFINVALTCPSMDELATTLAVENYAKEIVRQDVKGKGYCTITSASLDGSILTRGLPNASPVDPDVTHIRYMAEVECQSIKHEKRVHAREDHKPKIHKVVAQTPKPKKKTPSEKPKADVTKTTTSPPAVNPLAPPPLPDKKESKPAENNPVKTEEPKPEEKPSSPLPGTKPFWQFWD